MKFPRSLSLCAVAAVVLGGCASAASPPTNAPIATSAARPTMTASATPSSSLAVTVPTPTASALPSHGRIAFSVAVGPHAEIATNIFTIEPDGTDLKMLTHATAGCNRSPAWTPNGDRIVFDISVPSTSGCDSARSTYLAWMSADGGAIHRLTTVSAGVFDDSPTVSPDGTRIAFSRFDLSGRLTGIWLIGTDGSHPVRVTTTPAAWKAGGDQGPAFSPDGTRLVFGRDRGDNGMGALYTVGVDGTSLNQIVPESIDAGGPRWSPDGSRIVFANMDTATEHDIKVVNVDGSGLVTLTHETGYDGAGGPNWSPDGTRIVFTRYHAGDDFVGLAIMDADGSNTVVVWHPTPKTDNFPGNPVWGTAP
jgi:Tol biopolymer transport system component